MNVALLEKAIDEASRFRAGFVKSECQSPEDLLMLAVALMQQAETIFKEIGGSQLAAAAQFYCAADRMAFDAAPQTETSA